MKTFTRGRREDKPTRPFGEGILPGGPRPTEADRQWWASNAPGRDEHYDVVRPAPARGGAREWDRWAAESFEMERLEAGHCL